MDPSGAVTCIIRKAGFRKSHSRVSRSNACGWNHFRLSSSCRERNCSSSGKSSFFKRENRQPAAWVASRTVSAIRPFFRYRSQKRAPLIFSNRRQQWGQFLLKRMREPIISKPPYKTYSGNPGQTPVHSDGPFSVPSKRIYGSVPAGRPNSSSRSRGLRHPWQER